MQGLFWERESIMKNDSDTRVLRGTMNIFADLGYVDAEMQRVMRED
jgi:hypothetical protein